MICQDAPRARCYLEVNTAAIANNLAAARELLKPETRLIAVLKADAYGYGLRTVGRFLWTQGVRHFAVACLSEAFELRDALPEAWILCMGESLDGALDTAIRQDIRLTVGACDAAQRVSQAAQQTNTPAKVHFKVDTGLHRIGFAPDTAAEQIVRCSALPGIALEGLYTHLALHNTQSDQAQQAAFETVRTGLLAKGIAIPMAHMLDSIGITRYPQWQYDAVRVGAMLYGNTPNGYARPERIQPVGRFCARVTRVFMVKAGELIGYDDDHPLMHDTRVAVISAGYADGYPRVFSGKGEIEIRGRRARILGLICMDQMMADVTDIPETAPGDTAILLGGGVSLREYAQRGGLNRNECTAIITRRVPRIYL